MLAVPSATAKRRRASSRHRLQLLAPRRPVGGIVGRGEDLGPVGDLGVDRRRRAASVVGRSIGRGTSGSKSAVHGNLAATVRRANSSKPMPSKPAIVVASRFASGSIHAGGSAVAPARAPQIEPTVAPVESVSQPPATHGRDRRGEVAAAAGQGERQQRRVVERRGPSGDGRTRRRARRSPPRRRGRCGPARHRAGPPRRTATAAGSTDSPACDALVDRRRRRPPPTSPRRRTSPRRGRCGGGSAGRPATPAGRPAPGRPGRPSRTRRCGSGRRSSPGTGCRRRRLVGLVAVEEVAVGDPLGGEHALAGQQRRARRAATSSVVSAVAVLLDEE